MKTSLRMPLQVKLSIISVVGQFANPGVIIKLPELETLT